MPFLAFCQWIEASRLGAGVRNSIWVFPVVESIHILGIVLLIVTAALLDLRLLGAGILRRRPVSEVAEQLLPWIWGAVALMVITGVALFASEAASKCYDSRAFYVKMALIAAALVNLIVSHFTVYRHVAAWDLALVTPIGARLTACLSLAIWVGVVFAGRGIAYF